MPKDRGEYDLLDDVGFLLSRSSGVGVRSANECLGPLGLRVRSFSVLSLVVSGDAMSQRELSDLLGLDPSQVVALVDDLEAQRLIKRRPGSTDRRVRVLSATKLGRARLKAASRVLTDGQAVFLADLTPHEHDVLRELLRRIAFPSTGEAEAVS
jgi:DNA-binding MarR family transcriptional regulator